MKKLIIIICLFLAGIPTFAQQEPQFSHYMFNNMMFNPAYAGTNGEICVNLLSHQQWIKFEGAPLTNLMTIDSPLKILGHKFGVGLKMVDDRYGFVNDFELNTNIAYHREVGIGVMSFGLKAGIFNKLFKEPEWEFSENPETILPPDSRKLIFDMGLGFFYSRDNLNVGFSTSHLLRPKLSYEATTENGIVSEIFLTNHYFLSGAYNIQLANALIDLTPSFLIKSDGASAQFDINLNLLYNKKFWTGVTYRNGDAVVLFAGTSIFNNLKLGLSYDITFSAMRTASNGTFEAYVGYCFSLLPPDPSQRYHTVKSL